MHKLTMAAIALTTFALQGCIIYDDEHGPDCEFGTDCRWDDDGDWDEDDWCDVGEDGEVGDDCGDGGDGGGGDGEEPGPRFSLSLDPGQAELGETFLASVTAEGEFDVSTISGVRFTGGVEVLFTEVRETEVLVLVEVPEFAELGPADLVVSRFEQPAVLVEGALLVAEAGSGNSADDCE